MSSAAACGEVQSQSTLDERTQLAVQVEHLLDVRVAAVAARDSQGWAATVAPGYDGDGARVDALLAMPVTGFDLTLDSLTVGVGAGATATATVRTSYVLTGLPPAEHVEAVDVHVLDGQARFGRAVPVVAVTAGGTVPPWHLPAVSASGVPGGGTLLLWPATRALAESLRAETAAGVAAVEAAVGPEGRWRQVAVAAPATAADYEALVPGTGEARSGFAAVTADVPGPGERAADMVVLNPGVWPDLAEAERQTVLTHEIVHVAIGARTGGGQPLWLAEGFADHIALQPVLASGVTRQTLAPGVWGEVGQADALPGAADFSAGGPAAERAYTNSWLVVDFVARVWGEQALLDLHRRLAGTSDLPRAQADATADRVLGQVLGVDRAGLVQRWRDDLRALPGEGAP